SARNNPGTERPAERQALRDAMSSRSDRPLGEHAFRTAFAKAVRAVNVKAAERERDRKAGRTTLPPLPPVPEATSPRDLRHAYAPVKTAGGSSVVVVARRLGHSNPSMTLDVYSHLFADSEERTRSVVDAAWNTKINQVADSVRTSDGAQVRDLRR